METEQKTKRLFKIIGILLLAIGISCGLLATAEMYCYYLFSPGGRMYYEGFGFGSFMFGLIAAQNIGFYVISFTLIVIGYGHLKMKKWIAKVSIAFLNFWLITGIPVIGIALFVLAGVKDMSVAIAFMVVAICILFYFPIPSLLIRFYKSSRITGFLSAAEDTENKGRSWISKVPDSVLTLIFIIILIILIFFILIFFNGIFPVFGTFIHGLAGILIIDVVTAGMIVLILGLFKLQKWSWVGTLIIIGLLIASTLSTFLNSSYQDILTAMNFPAYEMAILEKIPAQEYHFALLSNIILIPTFILVILVRKHFYNKTKSVN